MRCGFEQLGAESAFAARTALDRAADAGDEEVPARNDDLRMGVSPGTDHVCRCSGVGEYVPGGAGISLMYRSSALAALGR